MHYGLTNKRNSNKDLIMHYVLTYKRNSDKGLIKHYGLVIKRNSIKDLIMHYDLTNKRNSNKNLIMHYGLTNKRNSSKDLIIYALWPDNQIKFQQGSYHLCIMAWHTNEIPTRILSFIMYDGVTNKRNSNKDLIIYHE